MVGLLGWSRVQRIIHWQGKPDIVGESAVRAKSLGTITALPVLKNLMFSFPEHLFCWIFFRHSSLSCELH